MGLETTNTIAGLVATNPIPSDPESAGQAHLTMIKSVLKNIFPGIGGNGFAIPITATEEALNFVDLTSSAQQQFDALSRIPINIQNQLYTSFITTYASNNFNIQPSPVPASLQLGLRFNVIFNHDGSGSDTLSIANSVGVAIKQYNSVGSKIPARIVAGLNSDIFFDGNDWILLNPITPIIIEGITGEVRCFGTASAPSGWLACGTSFASAQTLIASYPELATALGSTWNGGSVPLSGYFTRPWTPVGGAFLNGIAPGTQTTGQVIAHTHTESYFSYGSFINSGSGFVNVGNQTGNTGSTGGANNLAAGAGALWCVKT